jgi:hypothetical protein
MLHVSASPETQRFEDCINLDNEEKIMKQKPRLRKSSIEARLSKMSRSRGSIAEEIENINILLAAFSERDRREVKTPIEQDRKSRSQNEFSMHDRDHVTEECSCLLPAEDMAREHLLEDQDRRSSKVFSFERRSSEPSKFTRSFLLRPSLLDAGFDPCPQKNLGSSSLKTPGEIQKAKTKKVNRHHPSKTRQPSSPELVNYPSAELKGGGRRHNSSSPKGTYRPPDHSDQDTSKLEVTGCAVLESVDSNDAKIQKLRQDYRRAISSPMKSSFKKKSDGQASSKQNPQKAPTSSFFSMIGKVAKSLAKSIPSFSRIPGLQKLLGNRRLSPAVEGKG